MVLRNHMNILFVALGIAMLAGCGSKSRDIVIETATSADLGEVVPPGPLMSDQIAYQFAIYYLPKPAKDPLQELDALLAKSDAGFERVEKFDPLPKTPSLVARIESNPSASYAPPEVDLLNRFGRGLSDEQANLLQSTQSALIVNFTYSQEHVWDGLRDALELMQSLAEATDGLIWDESTREVFTPAAWHERRLVEWTEPIPDVSKHTVIHAYQDGEYVRAITLGMQKFGLPDVVVEDFSWSLSREMGIVVNLVSQSLAEGAAPQEDGIFDLDIRAIQNLLVREPQVTALLPNATGIANLTLRKGERDEGDPDNRLVEIAFDRGSGGDPQSRQQQILSAALGSTDQVSQIKHDEELKKVSREARAKLPALKADFNKGLEPGEFILVKAPFETPSGGREWMWVEVISWQGDEIQGILKNDPHDIPALHAGESVNVSAAEVFDYIRHHADGTQEGNETGKVIERQSR